MAFDFLSLGDGGNNPLEGIGSAITGISSLLHKRDPGELPTLQPWVNALYASGIYSNAAMNPESPYFKNVAAIEEEKNRENLIAAIRQMVVANNRAAARGTYGVGINPERADEARFQAISRGFQKAQQMAREQAREILMQAAGAQRDLASGYAGPTGVFGSYADANSQRRSDALGAIMKGIEGLGGIFGKKTEPQDSGQKSLLRGGGGDLSKYMSYQSPNFDYRINIS